MNRIKKWLKEYKHLIIACIMLALFLKVCNFDDYTYSDHNQITQYEYIIDNNAK